MTAVRSSFIQLIDVDHVSGWRECFFHVSLVDSEWHGFEKTYPKQCYFQPPVCPTNHSKRILFKLKKKKKTNYTPVNLKNSTLTYKLLKTELSYFSCATQVLFSINRKFLFWISFILVLKVEQKRSVIFISWKHIEKIHIPKVDWVGTCTLT